MIEYLKYLLQLILSPGHGWEDLERRNPDPEELLRSGLYPLLGIAAATEFLAFFWERHIELSLVLVRAMIDFGSYFIAIFIAQVILDLYLPRVMHSGLAPDARRVSTMIVCGIGLMVIAQIINNCLPWRLILLKFMPIYVGLVLYKGARYMSVGKAGQFQFLCLAGTAIVIVPLALYYLLYYLT